MMMKDNLGLDLTGATGASAAHYEAAIRQLQCYIGDPVASVDAALRQESGLCNGARAEGVPSPARHRAERAAGRARML